MWKKSKKLVKEIKIISNYVPVKRWALSKVFSQVIVSFSPHNDSMISALRLLSSIHKSVH